MDFDNQTFICNMSGENIEHLQERQITPRPEQHKTECPDCHNNCVWSYVCKSI